MKSYISEAQKIQLEHLSELAPWELAPPASQHDTIVVEFKKNRDKILHRMLDNSNTKIDACKELARENLKTCRAEKSDIVTALISPMEDVVRYLENPIYAIAQEMLAEIKKYETHLDKEIGDYTAIINKQSSPKLGSVKDKAKTEAATQLEILGSKKESLEKLKETVQLMGQLRFNYLKDSVEKLDLPSREHPIAKLKLAIADMELATAKESQDERSIELANAKRELLALQTTSQTVSKDKIETAELKVNLAQKNIALSSCQNAIDHLDNLSDDVTKRTKELAAQDNLIKRKKELVAEIASIQKNISQSNSAPPEIKAESFISAEKRKNETMIALVQESLKESKPTIEKKRFGKIEGEKTSLSSMFKGAVKSKGSEFIKKMDQLVKLGQVAQGVELTAEVAASSISKPGQSPTKLSR